MKLVLIRRVAPFVVHVLTMMYIILPDRLSFVQQFALVTSMSQSQVCAWLQQCQGNMLTCISW